MRVVWQLLPRSFPERLEFFGAHVSNSRKMISQDLLFGAGLDHVLNGVFEILGRQHVPQNQVPVIKVSGTIAECFLQNHGCLF
jgi:hypothetical protein